MSLAICLLYGDTEPDNPVPKPNRTGNIVPSMSVFVVLKIFSPPQSAVSDLTSPGFLPLIYCPTTPAQAAL